MSELSTALADVGVKLSPLQQDGSDVALTWDPAVTGPVFGDEVLVALPDMHLASGADGDIFRGFDGSSLGRLQKLLSGLLAVRGGFPKLSLVQMGDLYDVWRAYPQYKDHPTSDYRVIEKAYGSALGMLTQQLQARICVGNHDAGLGLFPPAWARGPNGVTDQLAYGHTFGSGRVLAFHGHQADRIGAAMAAQGGSAVVQVATEVAKLANPLVQLVERGIDLLGDFFGDTPMSLSDALNARWAGADPPSDAHGFQSPRWCDRGDRDHLQTVVGALPNAADIRMVFVGHSHRPGISALHVPVPGRLVPLVDVGSWVWGRSQIALACEGEVRLWTMAP